MTQKNEQKILDEILGDDFTKQILSELGVQDLPAEAQASIMSELGKTILERIMLEILKALPPSEHDRLEAFYGSNDVTGMRAVLVQHIPDFEEFVRREARNEYEAIKTGMHMREQGVQ